MSLTILSGSPKSGKTRQAYLLAAKVAETGEVLIFTEEDRRTLQCLAREMSALEVDFAIRFVTLFDIDTLQLQIEDLKPTLVIIDNSILNIDVQRVSDIADHTNTQILLVRNTIMGTHEPATY
jgi:predicted ATP-dependent serine protease